MEAREVDARIRVAAFRWLRTQVDLHGDDVLSRELLLRGFEFDGLRVPLMSQQGIFKPAALPEIPLSIMTSPECPYDDSFESGNLLRYSYCGTDPMRYDNVGLRKAMARHTPLVYFIGVVKGRYLAVWPAFIVADDPAGLAFTVAVDDAGLAEVAARRSAGPNGTSRDAEELGRRTYITATVRTRLHQKGFRERVLRAYRDQCALCCLRHRDLLDAAHIIPDKEQGGEPLIANGLSLCKIHHAAFDRFLIGIRPDYVVEVQERVLREEDGPMLRHGLQGLHDSRLVLPKAKRDHPDRERLARRYARFRGDSGDDRPFQGGP